MGEGFMLRCRMLRRELGLTQQALADRLTNTGHKVSRAAIGGWETGKSETRGKRLRVLARFFGVSTDFLLGQSDVRAPAEVMACHMAEGADGELTAEAKKVVDAVTEFVRQKYGEPPKRKKE